MHEPANMPKDLICQDEMKQAFMVFQFQSIYISKRNCVSFHLDATVIVEIT